MSTEPCSEELDTDLVHASADRSGPFRVPAGEERTTDPLGALDGDDVGNADGPGAHQAPTRASARGPLDGAPPVIELRGVERHYRGEPPIRALDGVDLRIEQGELVAIIGPSGSGKSTLINVMGTLDRPTAGSVLIDGIDTRRLSERKLCGLRAHRLGFVFQGFHLVESASVIENVADGLVYQGVGRGERLDRAAHALELVGLGDRTGTKPPKLSGGQRQRVAIARAIVARPSLLLADEPTGNLDSTTSESILALLHDLNRDHGVTIAIITHDADVAAQAPRRIRVRDGKVSDDLADPQPVLVGADTGRVLS